MNMSTRKRGCKRCGSMCGLDGCRVCEGDYLCRRCWGEGGGKRTADEEDDAVVEHRQIADCGCTHSPCPCESADCPYYGASCNLCPVHAAAPDLLAVLEEMTPDYEHCAPDESGYTETYRLRLIAKARAAIAAAKGEEK